MAHVLEWPSLTVQWLPVRAFAQEAVKRSRDARAAHAQDVVEGDADYKAQRLLLGTQADAGEQNYLMIAEAKARSGGAKRASRQRAVRSAVPR